VSKRTPRRSLVALVLLAALAAAVHVGVVLDRDTPRTLVSSSPEVNVTAANTQPASPTASAGATARSKIEADGDTDAALDDLEKAFSAASEEELDLIAAARLPDIVRRDPLKTARFVELRTSSRQREVLIRHFSRFWGESDIDGAFAWAQSLPDAQENNLARRGACLSLSQTNAAAAVERCAQSEFDAEGEAGFQGLFQTWAQSDPASAGEWLDAQPASSRTDALRQRYVHVLAKTDSEQALRMTQGFTFTAHRDEAILTVLHQWGLQDSHAARDWVENQAPDGLKARALAEIEGIESYAANR
jgi:hypothetical protein